MDNNAILWIAVQSLIREKMEVDFGFAQEIVARRSGKWVILGCFLFFAQIFTPFFYIFGFLLLSLWR